MTSQTIATHPHPGGERRERQGEREPAVGGVAEGAQHARKRPDVGARRRVRAGQAHPAHPGRVSCSVMVTSVRCSVHCSLKGWTDRVERIHRSAENEARSRGMAHLLSGTTQVRLRSRTGSRTGKSWTAPIRHCVAMPRLRTVSPNTKGLSRRRAGSGFVYLDQQGQRITDTDEVQRIRSLAIPPAWTDVWICPYRTATSRPAGRGRKGPKAVRVPPPVAAKSGTHPSSSACSSSAGKHLPRIRERIFSGPAASRGPRSARTPTPSGCWTSHFRVGSDKYADRTALFGLTTLHNRHVAGRSATLLFRFHAKSGNEYSAGIEDPEACRADSQCRCRGGEPVRVPAGARSPTRLRGGQLTSGARTGPYRQGLPHLARYRARGRRARAAPRSPATPRRSRQRAVKAAVQRGRRVPRQHPDHREELLHRPAGHRPLRERHHHRPAPSCTRHRIPGHASQRALEKAVLDLLS